MKKTTDKVSAISAPYEGSALFSDPIHGYIRFTVPYPHGKDEATEKDLIDSPWGQRLRSIYQLQSSRWVYPSAEHSRFQHSIGAMHVAGRFARQIYPSLAEAVQNCPSAYFIEEILRVAALLHDVGHGPFCHFFDENVLQEFAITHETIGQEIIVKRLCDVISAIRRSPTGHFDAGETIHPEHVAFLIAKDAPPLPNPPPRGESGAPSPTPRVGEGVRGSHPRWLTLLRPVLEGIYDADNLDYVLRDSYMCGVAVGPVDIDRLLHYTFYTEKGLTLHRSGCAALSMFLTARLYLYSNVYYHRTTRAIDLHLKEIFRDTVRLFFPGNPLDDLDSYLSLTDWSLLESVRRWASSQRRDEKTLGREWERILRRDVKWKMAYEAILSPKELEGGKTMIRSQDLEEGIRSHLPATMRKVPFRVDMATRDARPLNPLMMGERQIHVFNPSTDRVAREPLAEFFDYIPVKVVLCRIFTLNHTHDTEFSVIMEKLLGRVT